MRANYINYFENMQPLCDRHPLTPTNYLIIFKTIRVNHMIDSDLHIKNLIIILTINLIIILTITIQLIYK